MAAIKRHAAKAAAPNKMVSVPGTLAKKTHKRRASQTKGKAKEEIKTKRTVTSSLLAKKKKKEYTAEQLGVPKLNGIVPVDVQKPRGKRKGKVYVDDADTMLALMNVAQANREGEREGKIMRQRQLEEIREVKRLEAEKKAKAKQDKFEQVKDSLRKKKKTTLKKEALDQDAKESKPKKSVSFG